MSEKDGNENHYHYGKESLFSNLHRTAVSVDESDFMQIPEHQK